MSGSKKILNIKRTIMLLMLPGVIALVVLLILFEPVQGGIFPPCFFNYFTGLYCPGCGATRCLHSLLHGNFLKALDYNLLLFFMIPVYIYIYIAELEITLKGKPLLKKLYLHEYFYYPLIISIVLFSVLRNINVFPFNALAP